MTQVDPRKDSDNQFAALVARGRQGLVVHYACEGFDDAGNETARIACIAVRSLADSETIGFSVNREAELLGIQPNAILENFAAVEKSMLAHFYKFVASRPSVTWIHWNARDPKFGFPAIAQRFQIQGGRPVEIRAEDKFDLGQALCAAYGDDYVGHPRLENLLALNPIANMDFRTGRDQAQLFRQGAFGEIQSSVLRKVDVIANIVKLAARSELKTAASQRGPGKVFISHAVADKSVVRPFRDLIEGGIGISAHDIFCSSAQGQGIRPGRDFKQSIRQHLNEATVVIALISPNFYASAFCMCELGGVWLQAKAILPVLIPPFDYSDLKAVLEGIQVLKAMEGADLDSLRDELAHIAGTSAFSTARWTERRNEFLAKMPGLIAELPAPPTVSAATHNSVLAQLETQAEDSARVQQVGPGYTGAGVDIKLFEARISELESQNRDLQGAAARMERERVAPAVTYAGRSFSDIYAVLEMLNVKLHVDNQENRFTEAAGLRVLLDYHALLASGVTNQVAATLFELSLFGFAGNLVALGLADAGKEPAGAVWQRIQLNAEGKKFLTECAVRMANNAG